jgi:hypothetical protein
VTCPLLLTRTRMRRTDVEGSSDMAVSHVAGCNWQFPWTDCGVGLHSCAIVVVQ